MITNPTSDFSFPLTEIKDLRSLQQSIAHLKALKSSQEEMLREDIMDFIKSLNPVSIVKDSLHDLASDKEVQFNLVKIGINFGAELLTAMLFGKQRSLPGFLGAKVVKKIAGYFFKNKSFDMNQRARKLPDSEYSNEEESETSSR